MYHTMEVNGVQSSYLEEIGTFARYVVCSFNWLKPCCVVLSCVCVCVWLCWDSWGIKRSIYPETNSAFLLVSGESDQTPGLIPYSAVPSLSKPAFTHKSLADPFLSKHLLIFRFSTAQLATPCYSLESVCGVLFDSIGRRQCCCCFEPAAFCSAVCAGGRPFSLGVVSFRVQ